MSPNAIFQICLLGSHGLALQFGWRWQIPQKQLSRSAFEDAYCNRLRKLTGLDTTNVWPLKILSQYE